MSEEKRIKIESSSQIIAKPEVVLKEEADNWGILYDADTDISFGINPVSVFIWKQMKGKNSVQELVTKVHANCTDVPGNAEEHVIQFIQKLLDKGLATLETRR